MGYKCKEKYYKFHVKDNPCDVLTYDLQKGTIKITIIPDMISTRRPYPIYVYLFAIAIYMLIPKLSQRKAASITGQCFGIKTFSASTLCRVKKKLESKIYELAAVFNGVSDEMPSDDDRCEETVAYEIEEYLNEEVPIVPTSDGEETKTKDEQSGPVKLSLEDAFRGFRAPYFNDILKKLEYKIPTQAEKTRFKGYISRCCLKYFLLYRQLII